MIKIIKQGIDPKDYTYAHKCYECDTIFTFQKTDFETVYDQRDGDFLRIVCPVCKDQCCVNLSNLKKIRIKV